EQLDRVEIEMSRFLADVQHELRLEQIAHQVDEKRQQVRGQLHLLAERADQEARDRAAEERDRQDRSRFQTFLELREDAQLYAAVTGVLLSADHLEKFRASAHQALAIYARDPQASDEAWTLADPLPTALTEAQQNRVRDGCYHLLLILSQGADAA